VTGKYDKGGMPLRNLSRFWLDLGLGDIVIKQANTNKLGFDGSTFLGMLKRLDVHF
jgi:hypothetical protein